MQHATGEKELAASGPLGRRCITQIDDNGGRWVAQQVGGHPRHGEAYLTLSLALGALHDALAMLGVGPEYGPAPVAVTMPEAEFLRLRDALVAQGEHAHFKTHPSRVRIDESRRSFMLRGITVCAGNDAVGKSLSCPSRRKAATARGEG
jgi:hypothetical protein